MVQAYLERNYSYYCIDYSHKGKAAAGMRADKGRPGDSYSSRCHSCKGNPMVLLTGITGFAVAVYSLVDVDCDRRRAGIESTLLA